MTKATVVWVRPLRHDAGVYRIAVAELKWFAAGGDRLPLTFSRLSIRDGDLAVVDLVDFVQPDPQEFKPDKDLGCGFHGTVIEDYGEGHKMYLLDTVNTAGRNGRT